MRRSTRLAFLAKSFCLFDLEANSGWLGVFKCWINFPSSFNHLFDHTPHLARSTALWSFACSVDTRLWVGSSQSFPDISKVRGLPRS